MSRIAKPSYKNSTFTSPADWERWLNSKAFIEDGIQLMNRDLLSEELSQASPMLRAYIKYLESKP